MTRVMVVSKSQTWLRGMRSMLESEGLETDSGDRLLESVRTSPVGCVVFQMDNAESHSELRAFREEHKHLPVVGAVVKADLLATTRVLRAGATSVVADDDNPETVAESVRLAIAGRVAIPASIAASLARHVPDTDDTRSWISDTQADWLRAMADGSTVADIAEDVGYSERAMFRQLKALYTKLGVANRTEALLWAKQRGLLD